MEMNILWKIRVFTKEVVFLKKNIGSGSRESVNCPQIGLFLQKLSRPIWRKMGPGKVFTIKRYSLIRGVHYEKVHCICQITS